MATAGKSLSFTDAEISELLDLNYGDKRVFSVLSMLYPGLDLTKNFHEDHIFPRSRFTKRRLRKAGVPEELLDECMEKWNGLPNLQLLQGTVNIEKQDVLPHEWLVGPNFASEAARIQYINDNDLQELPDEITGFLAFYNSRREALDARLRSVLGVD
jgi:hypothetical protein